MGTWAPVISVEMGPDFPGGDTPTGSAVPILETRATWDRGLDAILDVTDPNENVSKVHRDGLGRITALLPPRIGTSFDCAGGAIITDDFPTVVIGYELTDSPEAQPVSRVITSSILQCYAATPHHQLQSVAYVDGLGRPRATLTTGDDEHAWVQSRVGVFTPRGTAARAHTAAFIDDLEPAPATAVAIPATAHSRATYDAFGRARAAIAEDGSATWTSYHALSTDVCDPLDNDPRSPHYRTCTTARTDGHGRVVDQIQRNRQPGSTEVEFYRLFTTYRQDGAVTSIRRAQTDGDSTDEAEHESIRNFVYDTVGRRIASTDPDTDSRTNSDPASNTWRYLFNRVGDLVAVRDPRGCGQNFYYDLGGRLVGERYVLCDEAQVPSEDTVESVPAGVVALAPTSSETVVDARYFFDIYPDWTTEEGNALSAESFTTDHALGRATGVTDRGQRSTVSYDPRGNVVWTGRLLAVVAPGGSVPSVSGSDPSAPAGNHESIDPASVVYDGESEIGTTESLYQQATRYDHGNRVQQVDLARGQYLGAMRGNIAYGRRGLPVSLSAGAQTIITDVRYTADGLTERVTYGDSDAEWPADPNPTVEETEYDIRRRPVRSRITRQADFDSVPGTLQAVNRIVDQELVWDVASNLVALVDDRDPTEWPEGFRPQSVHVEHDSLYRVTGAHFDYTQEDGSRAGDDVATDYRDTMATVREMDPMRTRPAPMLPAQPTNRVSALEWRYDWLANMTAWREPRRSDDGTSFYERELGKIVNGSAEAAGRPSALRLATNLDASASGTDRGGWLSVDYGDSGNVVALTVRAQCHDAGGDVCQDLGDDETTTARRAYLLGHCNCASEQHYQYRWDELNRLVEARRYDRGGSGDWAFAVRQRYRYDAANQRVVKESVEPDSTERIALYPFPGDLERRGLERSVAADAYVQGAITAEDQFLIGGARIVHRFDGHDEGGFDPWNRVTVALTDLIGSTSAVIDLPSRSLVETSTFYPNGATESYRALVEEEPTTGPDFAPREPEGFTGKEADEEVGLVYFGERYLIPRIGRWATPDPLHVHAGGGGEALNSYHYVGGNLLQARDPLGLTCNQDESCVTE